MNDKPVIEKIGVATIVSIIPTKVWIESGMFGERYVMRQHEGYPAFEYARFGYDYSHTSNSQTMNDATRLALALGATEPVEHKNRDFISFAKSPVEIENETLRARIAELEEIVSAPRGTDAQILKERGLTCDAALGAIMFGGNGSEPPPDDAAWLRPFYDIGKHIAELEAAAVPVQAIPGWQWVPTEPTDEMLANVDELVGGECHSCSRWKADHSDCRRVYAAMLSAAPTPSSQPATAIPDSLRIDALWQEFCATDAFKASIAYAKAGAFECAFYTAFRAGVAVKPAAPSPQAEPPQLLMPKIPIHPEPHTYAWTEREIEVMNEWGKACFEAGKSQHTQDADSREAIRKPQYPVGCSDASGKPDAAGCCNVTVAHRCDGCPHDRAAIQAKGGQVAKIGDIVTFKNETFEIVCFGDMPGTFDLHVYPKGRSGDQWRNVPASDVVITQDSATHSKGQS